jgi:putative hemolysin
MLTLAVLLALFILASAFFTAAELAIFFPSESKVRSLSEKNVSGAAALAQLRVRPERTLVLLRLADTICDVSAGALTAYLTFLEWEIAGLAIAIGIVSFLVLYMGELVPMGFAATQGQRLALSVAPTLLIVTRVLSPLLLLLARMARMRPERRKTAASITETEIRQLTALGHTEGQIEEHERELIERAFRLDETKAWEIMVPRVDVFAWSDDRTLADIAGALPALRHSRVPVYGDSIDDITGVLYLRDAYQALLAGRSSLLLRDLAREPLVVPGSLPLSKLLREFQQRRIHLAIVVDEYGGTDGLVTLEDVLEELVGEIVDETDDTDDSITRVSANEIMVRGDVDVRDINEFFDTALPLLEHRSLNGYLLEELGRVPDVGDTVAREGISIEVVEASETQVVRARLRRTASAPDTVERVVAVPRAEPDDR